MTKAEQIQASLRATRARRKTQRSVVIQFKPQNLSVKNQADLHRAFLEAKGLYNSLQLAAGRPAEPLVLGCREDHRGPIARSLQAVKGHRPGDAGTQVKPLRRPGDAGTQVKPLQRPEGVAKGDTGFAGNLGDAGTQWA